MNAAREVVVVLQIVSYLRMERPGEGMMGEPVELVVSEQGEPRSGGRMEAYERLLGDAARGGRRRLEHAEMTTEPWPS
jgi:glucose-6-phosphate 1-dehydrogenase